MFVLTILGSVVVVAVLLGIARRSRETKIECGPIHPCFGAATKREKKL